jgi:DHA1 family bicyclomycin/chloramphenicol resistance-like MFS transporter
VASALLWNLSSAIVLFCVLCGQSFRSRTAVTKGSLASRRPPGWLVFVAAMSVVGPLSIDMYLPGFPSIERDFHEHGVERTMAAYMIGIAVAQLFFGPISDRFGRKPPLYFGFFVYVLGSLGCALSANMTVLTITRVVQALGGCAGFVIGRAIVRDRCQPHEAARAFSMLMVIFALGPMVAPVLGGAVVTAVGWRGTFYFQALFGSTILVALHFILSESRDTAAVKPLNLRGVVRDYVRLIRDPVLLGCSLIAGFGMGSMFSYVAGSPTIMAHLYSVSPQQFGWQIGLNGIAFMSASRLNMIALRNRSPSELLAGGIWRPTAVGLLLVGASFYPSLPLWCVIVLQFLFFISVGLISPNVTALGLAPHGKEAGSASALMGSIQSAIAMLFGSAIAIFNDATLRPLTLIMAVGAICAWLSFGWVKRAQVSGT